METPVLSYSCTTDAASRLATALLHVSNAHNELREACRYIDPHEMANTLEHAHDAMKGAKFVASRLRREIEENEELSISIGQSISSMPSPSWDD